MVKNQTSASCGTKSCFSRRSRIKIDQFKLDWQAVGDSIVVVGGDGLYNCHIHSNDIGESIEAGIRAGRPYQIRVTDLQEELFHIEDHIEVEGASEIIVPNPMLKTPQSSL